MLRREQKDDSEELSCEFAGSADFNSSSKYSTSGSEDGDNSLPGQGYYEQTEEHPLGTGELSIQSLNEKELDRLLNIAEIERRFLEATRIRLKASSQKDYLQSFSRFAKSCNLERYSRRQLAGHRGKKLIIEYLASIPRPSWRVTLSQLRCIWVNGMGLAWPIDNKMDIGRLPRSRREPTPSDDVVREWAEAVAREKDPYLRLIWLFIAQHGWRPSHATGIRWGDIQYDSTGQPYAIVSRGARGEFKTFAPVAARLSHDVIQALQEWKKVHPEPYSDTWVLPWRSAKGIIRVYQRINKYVFHANWKRLRKKYSLPPLRPKDMRHWVATTCRKAGLSKIATAYLQGHDATEGGAMRDWYDNPRLEEIFEEQENCLPNGPLGTLLISNVEVMPGIPNEAISLLQRYITGKIGTLDFVSLIEEIRAKCLQRLSV